LVAVVGIKLPNDQDSDYFITDLAVKPGLRAQGIGSRTLDKLFELHPLKPDQKWRAFVDVDNPKAKAFLEKNKWLCDSETSDEHGMFRFIYAE
jgi:ribosomal protein S18 acetylase RimI-like enzyme